MCCLCDFGDYSVSFSVSVLRSANNISVAARNNAFQSALVNAEHARTVWKMKIRANST